MTSTVTPSTLGPFRVVTPMASGGMGSVLLAKVGDELVALKRTHPHLVGSPEIEAMVRAEARYLALIDSPHVVRFERLIDDVQGELLLAIEYVHGVSLAFLLDLAARAASPLPVAVIARVSVDMLHGLSAVHHTAAEGARLVHGDFNPRNVLIGVSGLAKVCDLGLAMPEGRDREGGFRGTPAYGAPEQVARDLHLCAGDVFAAGVVLWEALRMERLFRGGNTADTLRRVVELEAPALDEGRPSLSALASVVAQALCKQPERRPTALAMADAIEGQVTLASRAEVGAEVEHRAKRELERRLGAV